MKLRARYLPLLWPVQQSGAAVEPNDVILLQSYSLAYFFLAYVDEISHILPVYSWGPPNPIRILFHKMRVFHPILMRFLSEQLCCLIFSSILISTEVLEQASILLNSKLCPKVFTITCLY